MIPVIGTAVYGDPKWVKRLVESVDYPVDTFTIINNNPANTQALDELRRKGNPYIENLHTVHLPDNIGAGGAWNLVIKTSLMAPYWVICNDDIAFTSGFLKELENKAQDESVEMIHAHEGDFQLGSYDFFMIRDSAIQRLGLFDENFYPAYCEDSDMIMRIRASNGVNAIKNMDSRIIHGTGYVEEYYEHGSQTKKTNPELSRQLTEINIKNFEYMYRKWGPGWRTVDPWPHPFNSSNTPMTATSFDLEYARSKYVGVRSLF